MATKRVKSDGLNLRRTPKVEPGNILGVLPLVHEVEVLGPPDAAQFVEVDTRLNGATQRGFVHSGFLRDPVSQPREALMQEAVEQWIRFERGDGKETVDPFFRFVGEFWKSIGLNLDGTDTDQPWSAAFISFVARKAGFSDFRFGPAHSRYIRDAKEKRFGGVASAPFWLFRLGEHKPELGDLVCLRRQPGITFDNLPSGGFKSHTDVVVEIHDQAIRVLGGDVGRSVTMSSFSLTADGFLKEEERLFAIMRNNRSVTWFMPSSYLDC